MTPAPSRQQAEGDEKSPPQWFWRVVMAVLATTGLPALGVIVVLWSRLAVIEERIEGLRQALQSSATLTADVTSLRVQQSAMIDRLTRMEARMDRQSGGNP